MPVTSPTKPSTPRLSELARHVVVPVGIVATAWPSVEAKCRELGLAFDPWQQGAGRLMLAKKADGLYAAGVGGVAMSIPRQVGKTFLLGSIVFALCLLHPNTTVLWTAHRLRMAGETFAAMQSMARRKKIKPYVAKVILGSGEEEILFRNGSRILFGARERGFGRGFSGVDVIVFDEAQILTENAIDDMVPATNTAPNPLILMTGTPPKPTDPGEVFATRRREALEGETDDALYIEFSADPGSRPDDRAQWRKANPSHPKRTPVEGMLRMRRNLGAEAFLREGLGIWDTEAGQVLSLALWSQLHDEVDPRSLSPVALSVDMSVDHARCAIGIAGRRSDGLFQVDIAAASSGSAWVARRLAELVEKWHPESVVLDTRSPAWTLVEAIKVAGVEVKPIGTVEVVDGCSTFYNGVVSEAPSIRHYGDERLALALKGAGQRPVGDRWAWSRKNSTTDITPLVAVTNALHAVTTGHPPELWGFDE